MRQHAVRFVAERLHEKRNGTDVLDPQPPSQLPVLVDAEPNGRVETLRERPRVGRRLA
ncbi:MAG: hypothetical protein JRE82_16805 [Deltaproteobacteria bacterium]|nr:hypothetical protein [Deltaproteobacteria bacterium]